MKFINFKLSLLKFLIFCIVISILNSSINAISKHRNSYKKRIPQINDIISEKIVQNTANHIIDNQLAKSDIENNPSRYKILTANEKYLQDMRDSQKIYEKDQNAYYNANSNAKNEIEGKKKVIETNSINANQRYLNGIYKKDPVPYYSPTPQFRIFSNKPTDKFLIPIQIQDLTDQTPSFNNLKRLEKRAEDIDKNEDINKISSTNKYFKDPKAYYDPSYQDKIERKSELLNVIEKVKSNLVQQNFNFTEENFAVKDKIENYKNTNRENTNEFIGESYYYDTEKFKNKVGKKRIFDRNSEAYARLHEVIEIESVGEKIGSKYYPNEANKVEANVGGEDYFVVKRNLDENKENLIKGSGEKIENNKNTKINISKNERKNNPIPIRRMNFD